MRLFKVLLAGAAVGVILTAFRDFENETWLIPAGAGARAGDDEAEPVLGYDGMDQDTLLDWLEEADTDGGTLERMHRYELGHRGREPVLAALEERME